MKHIVSWSGGPDSTACLVQVLTATSEPVVAFFAAEDNVPYQSEWAEAAALDAVMKMKPVLESMYRSFELHTITIHKIEVNDLPYNGGFVYPVLWALNEPVTFYIGRNADDVLADQGWVFWRTFQYAAFDAIDTPLVETNQDWSKKDIRAYLGTDLWDMTFSCLEPDASYTPCEHCLKCQERDLAYDD